MGLNATLCMENVGVNYVFATAFLRPLYSIVLFVLCRGWIIPRTLGHEIVEEIRLENLEQWFAEKLVIYLVFSSSSSSIQYLFCS